LRKKEEKQHSKLKKSLLLPERKGETVSLSRGVTFFEKGLGGLERGEKKKGMRVWTPRGT